MPIFFNHPPSEMTAICVSVAITYQTNGENATVACGAEAAVSQAFIHQLRVAGARAALNPQIQNMVAQAAVGANAGVPTGSQVIGSPVVTYGIRE